MKDYKELKDFAERIKAKGVLEQQYIAEGILELLSEALENKMQMAFCSEAAVNRGETPHPPQAVPLPLEGEGFDRREPAREGFDREALKGCIVEEANGDRWIVEGWVYEAKTILDDLDREIGLMAVRRTFTQEELEAGMFKVIGSDGA